MIELLDAQSTDRPLRVAQSPDRSVPHPPSVAPAVTSTPLPPRVYGDRQSRDPSRSAPPVAVGYEPGRRSVAGRLLVAACVLLVVGIVVSVAWSLGLVGGESPVLSSEQETLGEGQVESTDAEDPSSPFSALIDGLPDEPLSPAADDGDKMIIRIEPPAAVAEGDLIPATATIRNDGKLHVEGAFASESDAAAFLERAGDVFGSDNIVAAYLIDPEAPEPTVSDVALDKPVLFKSGSAEIDPEYIPFLEACGDVLKLNPSIVMSITAYTDSQGDSAFNLELSQARANAIVEFYRQLEIGDSQLVGTGFGEEAAFADNDTDGGRQQNRRAMLQLMNVMDES